MQSNQITYWKERADKAEARVEVLETCGNAINAIRNSIVAFQKVNWSEHMYPLVAALNEAGFEGDSYEVAHKEHGALLERTLKAEALAADFEIKLSGPGTDKFLITDGDGEQEKYGTLEEAQVHAGGWIEGSRYEARSDGEWPESVEGITIWVAKERAQAVPLEGVDGVDYLLRPVPTEAPSA